MEQDFRDCYIVHYRGIGGIGKSTLLRQELTAEEAAVPADVEQARAHVRELLRKKTESRELLSSRRISTIRPSPPSKTC